jgi:hypothetical protein
MEGSMDLQSQNIDRTIAELEAELERLFAEPGVPPGKRGELMERLRLLKLKATWPKSASS